MSTQQADPPIMLGELDEPGGPGDAGRDPRAVNAAGEPEVPGTSSVSNVAEVSSGTGVPDVLEGPVGPAVIAADIAETTETTEPATVSPDDRPAGYRDVFGVREFRAVFAADLLSLIGDQVAAVAVAVMLYQDSGSPLLAAAGYATAYVPWLLGGPLLAAWAERFPGRSVMVACDLARALLIAVAALAGFAPLVVAGLVFLSAMLAPPFDAARSALLAQILTGNRYPVGMSLRQAVHQIAQLCGFAAGGALVLAISAPGVLALNCLTFLASALLLWAGLVHRPAPGAKGEELEDGERGDAEPVTLGTGREGAGQPEPAQSEAAESDPAQSPYRPRRAPVVPEQRLRSGAEQPDAHAAVAPSQHPFDQTLAGAPVEEQSWTPRRDAQDSVAVPADEGLRRPSVTGRVPGPRGQGKGQGQGQGQEDPRWRPADQHPIEQRRSSEQPSDQVDGLADPHPAVGDLADELFSGLRAAEPHPTTEPTERRSADRRAQDRRRSDGRQADQRQADRRQGERRQSERRGRRQHEAEHDEQLHPIGTRARRRIQLRAGRLRPSQLRHRGRRAAAARVQRQRRAQTSSGTSIWSDMIAGAQVVRGDQKIWFPLLLGIVGAAYAIVPEAIAVAYASELGHSSSAVGLIMAAAAAGSVIGGLAIGRFAAPSTAARLMYPLALIGTLPLLIVALRPGLTISLALFALCGLGQAFQVVANTQFASHVPAEVRTRAFGIAIAGLYGGQSLAILMAGAAAQWLAPSTVIAGSGVIGAVGVLLLPGLQHAGSGLRGRHCHR